MTGVIRDGGYATDMLADVSALALVPDALDAIESAPLLCVDTSTAHTVAHTVNRLVIDTTPRLTASDGATNPWFRQ